MENTENRVAALSRDRGKILLTTANDHKRGAVRDAPRPGRAGGAVIAVSSRGYRGEPRRYLHQRHTTDAILRAIWTDD